MAIRRKLGNLAGMLLQARLGQQAQQQSQQRGFQNQAFEKVLGDPTGDIADRATKAGMKGFEGFVPNNTDIQGRLGEQIANTSDISKLDDPMSLIAKFQASPGGKIDPSALQPIEQLINQTNQRREALKQAAPLVERKYVNKEGVPSSKWENPYFPSEESLPTEMTGTQLGNKKVQEIGVAGKAEAAEAGRVAGSQAGASAAASAPYKEPTILYNPEGGAEAYRFGPKGAAKVDLPTGLTGKAPTRLPASEIENIAGINTAEVEGVKVLSALHSSGLDKSNNPLDPRWQKFVVTTLKVAPGDWQKADIQQRTAFVNAALTRNLMGARPSQYVAQIIQQHLPQGEMSGAQMAHVIHNVLQQAGERRIEIGSAANQTVKGPTSGMTYQQFNDSVKNEPQVPDASQTAEEKWKVLSGGTGR